MSPAAIDTNVDGYRQIDLSFDSSDSASSARRLIFALNPDWETSPGEVELQTFTDGITNSLFKAIKRRPGLSQHQVDDEAVLLRAYGNNTSIIIDREREARSHSLLASRGLAPPLLARFNNGLLYRFVQGSPCSPEDLRDATIFTATARRLGQWHALLPTSETISTPEDHRYEEINNILAGKPIPNIWTVMMKWIDVLPSASPAAQQRQAELRRETIWTAKLLGNVKGLNQGQYIVSHCDLLSGNVIKHPSGDAAPSNDEIRDVSFIDYEYATPAPAAFDLANHFAEWGGFECDYNVLPTRSQRRQFLTGYVESYRSYAGKSSFGAKGHLAVHGGEDVERDVDQLMQEVDLFRGMPGLYWGIWGLIQAEISQIDFDYASYAPLRLQEYYDWRAEHEGTRKRDGATIPVREQRWAQDGSVQGAKVN